MPGDARRRFCDACGKHVHDLSARTPAETAEFLREHAGTTACVRLARAAVLGAAASLAACSAADQVNQTTTVQIGPMQAQVPAPDAGADVGEQDYIVGDMPIPN